MFYFSRFNILIYIYLSISSFFYMLLIIDLLIYIIFNLFDYMYA